MVCYGMMHIPFHFVLFHCFLFVLASFHNTPHTTKEPFRVPVDWKGMGLFDYPTLIKKPMDLGTVKRNINARKYKSIPDASGT